MTEEKEKSLVAVSDNSEFGMLLDTAKFGQLQRVSKLFASSSMVPAHYQGKVADVFIALEMAFRMGVNPMMMLQSTYVVHGKPGMAAQLMIALANQRGPFSGPIDWDLSGEGMARKAVAFATVAKTGKRVEAECSLQMAKDEKWLDRNPKWKTMTDLMLRYRSASFLIRLYCPEVAMGMYSREELEDIERTGQPDRVYTVNESKKPADTVPELPAQTRTQEVMELIKEPEPVKEIDQATTPQPTVAELYDVLHGFFAEDLDDEWKAQLTALGITQDKRTHTKERLQKLEGWVSKQTQV